MWALLTQYPQKPCPIFSRFSSRPDSSLSLVSSLLHLEIVSPHHLLRSLDFLGNLAQVMENVNMIDYQVAVDGLRSGHEGGLDIEEVRVLFSCLFPHSLCHIPSFPRMSRFHHYLIALWLRVIDCNLPR